MGIVVGNSSVRGFVKSHLGAPVAVATRSGSKQIWIYSVPGVAALYKASDKLSTFTSFWADHAGCRNTFEVFFVPAKDSLAGN